MLTNDLKNASVIRRAVESDAIRICEVLIRSVREICASDYGNDPAILNDWCANKTPKAVTDWIEKADNFFAVAELPPHGIVGAAMYKRSDSSIYLCYLVPEGLNQGIGSRLLLCLEAEALRLGQSQITLGSSITAHSFYKRHGYVDHGEPVYWGKVLGYPMRKVLSV